MSAETPTFAAEGAAHPASGPLPAAPVARAHGVAEEVRALSKLAVPVVLAQVGSMMLGLVDTMMIARVDTHSLDSAALGNLWIFGTLIVGIGLVLGIDPIVSQAHGRGDGRAAALGLQRGIVVGLLASVPIGLLWLFTEPVLLFANQSADHAAAAATYVHAQLPTLPVFLAFMAMRQYLQGRGILAPTLVVIVAANVLNGLLNWMLIFGHLGSPAYGLWGSAVASAVARGFMFAALLAWILRARLHRGAWVPWSRESFSVAGLREVLHYGVPVGMQYGLEVWAFQVATLLAGVLGELELGAHTLILNMASFSFMFPMGVSHAAAVRVGNLIGARDRHGAQRAAWVAFGMGAGVMGIAALTFLVFREGLPRLYGAEAPVVALAASLLPIVAAFQLMDGVQVIGGGILRGMGRIRPAAVFNLVGYYAIALPLAYWLAFVAGLGLAGLWWGLAFGLLVIAAALIGWVAVRGPARMEAEPGQRAGVSAGVGVA